MANYAYYVFFDALSSHTNYKSKQEFRKYENRQKPIIFGKKWPNQGDNMRIIGMQLSKKNILMISGLFFIAISAWVIRYKKE